MKKIKKIFILLVMASLTLFIARCGKVEKKEFIKNSYYIESVDNSYSLIKEDVVESKEEADHGQNVSSFLNELKNNNYFYNESKFKTDKKDNVTTNRYYFDLQEYEVSIKINGEVQLYTKVKYLTKINIDDLYQFANVSREYFWFDSNNREIIFADFLVTEDIVLELVENETDNQDLLYLIVKANNILKDLVYDVNIKQPESYDSGLKIVSKEIYYRLKNAIDAAVGAVLEADTSVKSVIAELVMAIEETENNIIVGTKENSLYQLNKNVKQLFNDIETLIATIENQLESVIVLKVIEKDNYNVNQNLMYLSDFNAINDVLKQARSTLLLVENYYADAQSAQIILNSLNLQLTQLNNVIDDIDEKIITGTKQVDSIEYTVNIYFETKSGYPQTPNQTLEFSGYHGQFVYFTPQEEQGYTVDPNSVLIGSILDETLELSVYYKIKEFIIPINLNGGTNTYEENYVSVLYGEVIPQDIVDKLLLTTKQADDVHSSYEFLYFEDSLGNIIDLTEPITNPIILNAYYDTSEDYYTYTVHTYIDLPTGAANRPLYPQTPEITISDEEVLGGSLFVYNFELPEGFEVDEDKSRYIINKMTSDTVIELYLKRKVLMINIDLDGGVIDDERIVGSRVAVKYGQLFDFVVSGIEKDSPVNDKYMIYDKVLDLDTGQEYQLGNPITDKLNLKVIYRLVDRRIKVVAEHSYIGGAIIVSDNRVNVRRTAYIGINECIKDPAFFMPDTYDQKALFDVYEKIGFIKDSSNNVLYRDNIYMAEEGRKETTYNIKFVYRVDTDQAEDIMINDQFRNTLLATTEREVIGTILGRVNNLYLAEDESGRRFLVFASEGTSEGKLSLLQVGDKLKMSGPFVKNYNEFITGENNFLTGRFDEMVLKISNSSIVEVVEEDVVDTQTLTINALEDIHRLKMININDLLVLEVNGFAERVDGFDNGLAIDAYYSIKVVDKFGNIGYVHMANNNKSQGLKEFNEIKPGHIININDAALISARVNGEGVVGINGSKYAPYLGVFVENFYTQMEVLANDAKITLNYNFEEAGEFYPEHENFFNELVANKAAQIKTIIAEMLDQEFYNGYKFSHVTVNGLEVSLDDVIGEVEDFDLHFVKETKYIEFYLGSVVDEDLMHDLELQVTIGKKVFTTKPVDYDLNIYKFILSYNGTDPYINVTANFGYDGADEYLIIPDYSEGDVLKFVAYEGIKHNYVRKEFGNIDNFHYELTWGGFTSYQLKGNNKGLIMHAFTTETIGDSDFSDASLYSRLLTENSGLEQSDEEFYMNKDHNMQRGMYTYYEGGNFYQLDGNLSDEDIRNNNSFDLRSFYIFPKLEVNEDGEIYKTEENVKYYFYKDSLTKQAEYSKFGLGIVFVDLTPIVEINGVKYGLHSDIELPELPMEYQDSKLSLEAHNDRVFKTKEEFFAYLDANEIPVYDNAGKEPSLQHLTRIKDTLSFTILNNDVTFTSNNSNKLDIVLGYYDSFDEELLEVNNQNGRTMLIIDATTKQIIDYNYIFDNLSKTKYELLFVETEEVTISLHSDVIGEVGLASSVTNKYEMLSEDSSTAITKEYTVNIYKTDLVNYGLTNKFVVATQNKDLNNLVAEYEIPFTASSDNKYYHIIDKSNIILSSEENNGLMLFLHNNTGLPTLNDHSVRIVADGQEVRFNESYSVFTDVALFFITLDSTLANSVTSAYVYKGNSAVSIAFPQFIGKTSLNYRYMPTSTYRPVGLTAPLAEISDMIEVEYSTGWLENNTTQTFTTRRLSANNPYYIDTSMFDDVEGKEIIYAQFINGSYVSIDVRYPIIDSSIDKLKIKAFYKPDYLPGEYIKVYFNFDKYGYIDGLEEELLDHYLYLKVGDPLILDSVSINDLYSDYAIFEFFLLDGAEFDLSQGVNSGHRNITLQAYYSFDEDYTLVRYEEYMENPNINADVLVSGTQKEFVVDSEGLFTYDLSNVVVPTGYTIDYVKTINELNNPGSLAEANRVIKVYFKADVYKVTIQLNGGAVDFLPPGATEVGGNLEISIKYGQDLTKTSVYQMFYVAMYQPKLNGQVFESIRVTYFDGKENVVKTITSLPEGAVIAHGDVVIRFNYGS